jgi:hypothetical protein
MFEIRATTGRFKTAIKYLGLLNEKCSILRIIKKMLLHFGAYNFQKMIIFADYH